jgi:ABC-type multidrug transport system ATPase subunit
VSGVGGAACVSLRSVAKRYGRRGPWVLRRLEADVDPGAVIELRGANGAGKSTLLRLLVGATVPSRGSRVTAPGLRIGYAPDQLTPAPPFTARDYLSHHARLRRIDPHSGAEQSATLAERLGFAHLLSQRLAALSAGTQQKVLLVQALLGRPDLVVLDEPFSNLDADAREAIGALLLERSAAGTAIVFSNHGTRPDRGAAGHVWELRDGEIDDHARDGLRLANLPGLRAADVEIEQCEADRVRLLAAPEASDRVLAELIAAGWHIDTVGDHGDHGDRGEPGEPGERARIVATRRPR